MHYNLFRVPTAESAVSDGEWLGRYEDLDAALKARDDDATAVLDRPGATQEAVVCHRIVGGQDAETTHEAPTVVTLAARAHTSRGPEDEACEWFVELHQLAG
ncbi:MAG TPA: hypothetical protein VHC43_18165 [Mycobacteriales bacterium]|nr:hypothetical protein [Mycobacteriales bacterium]